MDTSIALGIVSVVLTILFFIVGYRQTIGARKERARAANKYVVDTLLRRYTLEPSFVINRDGIGKILAGTAIESRTKIGDLVDVDQLESVLYTKIVEHDFLDEVGRDAALGRLEASFKNPEVTRLPLLEAPSEDSRTTLKVDGTVALGFLAASLGIVVSIATIPVLFPKEVLGDLPIKELGTGIITSLALAIATSIVLSVFVRLRDANRSPTNPRSYEGSAQQAERAFAQMAKRANKSFQESPDTWIDYIVQSNGEKFGIEFKYNINRYGVNRAKSLVELVTAHAKKEGFSKAFLVSGSVPEKKYESLSNDTVSVVSMQDMLSKLRQSR